MKSNPLPSESCCGQGFKEKSDFTYNQEEHGRSISAKIAQGSCVASNTVSRDQNTRDSNTAQSPSLVTQMQWAGANARKMHTPMSKGSLVHYKDIRSDLASTAMISDLAINHDWQSILDFGVD